MSKECICEDATSNIFLENDFFHSLTVGGFAFGRDFHHKISLEADTLELVKNVQSKPFTPPDAKPFVQATPSVRHQFNKVYHLYFSSKIQIKMKGNEISVKELRADAIACLTKLQQILLVKEYGKGTVRNYCQEMKLLFKYYNHKAVADIRQTDIEQYLQYIKDVHKVGRAKCRSVAQACSFFFKRVMPSEYIVPSNLYPRKQFILPNIMSEEEVKRLFAAPLSVKEYCVVGLLYGCGLRISEVSKLRIIDIESDNKRIKVYQGKGGKDRYTLLPEHLLLKLRELYISEGRPKEYLFTSKQTKRAIHLRSTQVIVNSAMAKAGFKDKHFTAHTLRHSFATHMLNQGNNIHVIKTLLGHSKIETTMVYLHLQQHTQAGIQSPLETVVYGTAATR